MSDREVTWAEVLTSGLVFGVVVTVAGTILWILGQLVSGPGIDVSVRVLVINFVQFALIWALFGAAYSYFGKKRLY